AEDGIRDRTVTGVQTCALPIFEPVVACLAMVVVNFGLAVYQILWLTVMQEIVPDDRLGRVSSIDQLGGYGLWPVGFALAGVIAEIGRASCREGGGSGGGGGAA